MTCERLTLKHSTQFWQIWQNEVEDEKIASIGNTLSNTITGNVSIVR